MIYDYWDSHSVSSAYATSYAKSIASTSSLLDTGTEETNDSVTASSDTAEISSLARQLLERINSLDVFSCIYPDNNPTKDAKSLSGINNDFMSDFNSFSSSLNSLIGDSGTVTLGLDGKGGMTAEGDDAAVKSVSSSITTTATARFAVMAARAALVDAGNTVDGFADAYATDPYAAIQDNIDALGERLLGFRLQAGGGAAQYGFVRGDETVYATAERATDEAADSAVEAVAES